MHTKNKLQDIKVDSFITSIDKDKIQTAKGGCPTHGIFCPKYTLLTCGQTLPNCINTREPEK